MTFAVFAVSAGGVAIGAGMIVALVSRHRRLMAASDAYLRARPIVDAQIMALHARADAARRARRAKEGRP